MFFLKHCKNVKIPITSTNAHNVFRSRRAARPLSPELRLPPPLYQTKFPKEILVPISRIAEGGKKGGVWMRRSSRQEKSRSTLQLEQGCYVCIVGYGCGPGGLPIPWTPPPLSSTFSDMDVDVTLFKRY